MITTAATTWLRVSHKAPCPICRRPDWCGVTDDGTAACCMRVESNRPAHNGGWVHRLTDDQRPAVRMPPLPRPRHQDAPPDCGAMHRAWLASTMENQLADLAEALGVWYRSLARLGAAWAPPHQAWAFPMRDHAGAVIGIRLRAMDGRKWAVRGSRAGLIFDPALAGNAPLLICEGPTDTAAAMTAGFAAVGRPSCRGQEDLLRQLIKTRWHGDVVIVADNDPPHRRPDGTTWRPGLDGAMDLARELRRPIRLVVPPAKDLREWIRAGAGLRSAIANAAWLNVR